MTAPRRSGRASASSRRSHRKSRLGCANCKRRRIKCDEKKPSCTNCVQHSIRCDFAPASSSVDSSPGHVLGPAAPSPAAPSSAVPSPPSLKSPPARADVGSPASGLELIELELLQNYLTNTCLSLGSSYLWVWQKTIPQLGFSHHYVLQLLLAFSAYDIARRDPARSDFLRGLADQYQHAAVQTVTGLLPHLNAENSDPLYVSSVLICSLSFAKGPSPGDYLMISDRGASDWMVLNRGTRSILQLQKNALWAGRLSFMLRAAGRALRVAFTEGPNPEINEHTREFRRYLVGLALTEPNTTTYLAAWDRLVRTLKAMLDESDEGKVQNAVTFVFSWVYCLEENFILCLQQHQPLALVILAYFVVMLHVSRHQWFIEHWPEHIMAGIVHHIPDDHKHWIRWPATQIGWNV
ncbi:c6 finger domain [Diplodia corticola]|uniref:C6 finger domain n=1 Tax=Diplodia corticola TaxID=236234 RepID=A0A1J9R067_9PEZI|nr:c6 finger domain [Diplodia corticola]OJD34024.1 c6 finger domain [Diplodia corticola]